MALFRVQKVEYSLFYERIYVQSTAPFVFLISHPLCLAFQPLYLSVKIRYDLLRFIKLFRHSSDALFPMLFSEILYCYRGGFHNAESHKTHSPALEFLPS